jgi:hypothetical protein
LEIVEQLATIGEEGNQHEQLNQCQNDQNNGKLKRKEEISSSAHHFGFKNI